MHASPHSQSRRNEDRISMAVPVHLQGGASGTTRDISASGIYFETDLEPILESPLDFTVEFRNGGVGGLSLRCRGQVLRVEGLRLKEWIEQRRSEWKGPLKNSPLIFRGDLAYWDAYPPDTK